MTHTILQIETATTACSVTISSNGVVFSTRQINQRNIHAEVLTLFINELVKDAGLEYQQLDAVAVSSGPGSYTGLRIGVSTAKGLCFALDKPLIAVETLEAMAAGAIAEYADLADADTLFCPVIDARRMEVYTALFNVNGKRVMATSAEIIEKGSFNTYLSGHKILFFGDGAEKCGEVLNDNAHAVVLPGFVNSAEHLTAIAYNRFINKQFEDTAYFEPFYLKDFIAGKKAL